MRTSARVRFLTLLSVLWLVATVLSAQSAPPVAVSAAADPAPQHLVDQLPVTPVPVGSMGTGTATPVSLEQGVKNPAPAGTFATALATPPVAPGIVAGRGKMRGSTPLFGSLYAGLITTQALDVHSTFRALGGGHAEGNPMVRWATSHPALLIGVKAATTTGTIAVVERLRKKHPRSAAFLMTAIDTAYSLVVMHNYRAPIRR